MPLRSLHKPVVAVLEVVQGPVQEPVPVVRLALGQAEREGWVLVLRFLVRAEPELLLEEATATSLQAQEVAQQQGWVGERPLDYITIGDISADRMICPQRVPPV